MKKLISVLVLLSLLSCLPASADIITRQVIKQYEELNDDNFTFMCNYDEAANVGCIQAVYQLPYLDIYKLFKSDAAVENGFKTMAAKIGENFHYSMNLSDLHPATVLTVISSDNVLLYLSVNGCEVNWMKTNWNGYRPF